MPKRCNADFEDMAMHLRGPKHLWDRKSIFLLLNEYRKLKEFFNMMQVGQERKELWERITKKLHSAGYPNIQVQHVIKKFRSLRKDYRKFISGLNVGSRLYGYVNLLKEILHDDPYLFVESSKNKISEFNSTNSFEHKINDNSANVYKMSPWIVTLVDHFKEEQNKVSKNMWQLHQNIIAAEKKKNDLLESLINCLKSDYTQVEEDVVSSDDATITSPQSSRPNLVCRNRDPASILIEKHTQVEEEVVSSDDVTITSPHQSSKPGVGRLWSSKPNLIGRNSDPASILMEKHLKPKTLKASYVKNTLSPNIICDEEGSKVTVCNVPKIQFTYLDEKNGKLVSQSGEEGSVYEVQGYFDEGLHTRKIIDEHSETSQVTKSLNFIDFTDPSVNCSVKILSAAEFKKLFQECNKE